MGDRRMLTRKVTDDDHFINLSSSAQALYLHLSMNADDDGFCNQISICMFRAHASMTDLQALLENKYLIQFENGVIVIKHWRMANSLRKDRHTPTNFQEEFAQLELKENGTYTMKKDAVAERLPDGCQMVAERLPQYKLSKDKLSKDKLSKGGAGETRTNTRKSNVDLFAELEQGQLSEVYQSMVRWMTYKDEQKKKYTPTGIKSLITQVRKHVDQYGADAVAECIEVSMSNGYQGIIWDRMKKQNKQNRDESNPFLSMLMKEGGADDKTGSFENPDGAESGISSVLPWSEQY